MIRKTLALRSYILTGLVSLLLTNCKNEKILETKIHGIWYGQRQAVGENYTMALEKIVDAERKSKQKSENVNLCFKENGILQMIDNKNETNIIDSAKFKIESDSTLKAGNYKTKIIKISKDTLILYSAEEPILKLLRVFTRKK
ncbi:hypothetical protein ACTJKN_25860 [Pedobacter sp. 22163]|uniref:hypothetical protein n=1 Tax=Pedobacter sp. 22163 TaxID=3453883 RepID=UPI003F825BB7